MKAVSRWALALLLCWSLPAQAAPQLTSIFPMSCRRGSDVTVTLVGKELDQSRELVFSVAGVAATRLDDGRFQISVAEHVRPQDCDVWCVTDSGLSNPRRFVIGAVERVTEGTGNDASSTALGIPFPGAVDARLESAAKVDWFQFKGKAGDVLTLRCRSRTLDGSVEPAVALIGPNGRELAHSSGRRREPVLALRLPDTGSYRIRVTDRAYRKADGSFYRLESGNFSLAWFPDLVSDGQSSRFAVFAADQKPDGNSIPLQLGNREIPIRQSTRILLEPETNTGGWRSSTERFRTVVPADGGTPDSQAAVRLARTTVTVEDEAETESAKQSQALAVPSLVNGRFGRRGDIDWYSFNAKKDQTFRIDLYGNRFGRRMDLDAAIVDETGKTLTTFPDAAAVKGAPALIGTGSLDVSATWKAPADASYRLVVRDLYGSSLYGADRTYALHLRTSEPSCRVVVLPPDDKTPTGYSVPKGGYRAARVYVDRQDGFDANVVCLGKETGVSGISVSNFWTGPNEVNGFVVFAATDQARPGVQFPDLTAAAPEGEATSEIPIEALTLVRSGGTDGRYVDRLPVVVTNPLPIQFKLAVVDDPVAAGGKLKLTATQTRLAGSLKSAATLTFPFLPAGIKSPNVSIAANQESQTIELSLPEKMTPGRYSLVAVVAGTVIPAADSKSTKPKELPIQAWTNPVRFDVTAPPKP